MLGWEQGKRNATDKKVADDTSIIFKLPSALLLADTTSLLMRAWWPDTALLPLLVLLPRLPLLLMVLMAGAEAEVTPPLQPSPPSAPPCCLSARSWVILDTGGEVRTPEFRDFLLGPAASSLVEHLRVPGYYD